MHNSPRYDRINAVQESNLRTGAISDDAEALDTETSSQEALRHFSYTYIFPMTAHAYALLLLQLLFLRALTTYHM